METTTVHRLPWGFHWVDDLANIFQVSLLARKTDISREAKKRLQWMDHYRKTKNVSLTCRYFGIRPKTFYKWKKRFDPYDLTSLEDRGRSPKNKRKPEITPEQESRIISLRKEFIRLGKLKLKRLYQVKYGEEISSWKIQRVIQKYKLYYNPKKTAKVARKRQRSKKKKRLNEYRKRKEKGLLIVLDVIVIYWNSMKRYIFTAIDETGKVAFARMYSTKSSWVAKDFLERVLFLFSNDQKKKLKVGHDNGSEFHGYFTKACETLGIEQLWSRPKTPKDNPVCERFNRTLEEEFIQLGNFTPDLTIFNRNLTEWLIHYNFVRPHETLKYLTPMEFASQQNHLLPMYSSCTNTCNFTKSLIGLTWS
ncbi:MAG: integrase core domain-containing protein [bacterium]